MRIKITQELHDIDNYHRPRVGFKYDVLDVKSAAYKPAENNIKYIENRGMTIPVLNSECEVIG